MFAFFPPNRKMKFSTSKEFSAKNNTFPLRQTQKIPDGYNVREKHNESEKVAEPRTHKSLQRYHDNRQNHLGQEQGLGEAVQLQVQEADLSGQEV